MAALHIPPGQEAPGGGDGKQLVSDTLIRVQLQVPGWFLLPTAAIERTGEWRLGKAGHKEGR